jgi:hypothetical protein
MTCKISVIAALLFVATLSAQPQAGRGGAPAPPKTAKAAAPIDLTGYWVSQIVDEWRFRVSPIKGDINYMPLNAEARKVANAWDPAKDEADGNQCKAYGAVGVMQRPGRVHITWEDEGTLRIDTDAGTQTRLLHFSQAAQAQRGAPSWQGYSFAQWQVPGGVLMDLGGQGFVFGGGGRGRGGAPKPGTGSLKVVTTNMLPGYLRKNGVPYSANAVLTEYFNLLSGADGQQYISLSAFVEDPVYLNQPFIRTYEFKKQPDAAGWEPTPCLTR